MWEDSNRWYKVIDSQGFQEKFNALRCTRANETRMQLTDHSRECIFTLSLFAERDGQEMDPPFDQRQSFLNQYKNASPRHYWFLMKTYSFLMKCRILYQNAWVAPGAAWNPTPPNVHAKTMVKMRGPKIKIASTMNPITLLIHVAARLLSCTILKHRFLS